MFHIKVVFGMSQLLKYVINWKRLLNFILMRQRIKVVFIGDQNVGKSSIVKQLTYEQFNEDYQQTIGIDFVGKTYYINEANLRVQFWDTAGAQKYISLIPAYLKDGDLIIFICDLTNPSTLDNYHRIFEPMIKNIPHENYTLIMFANKSDSPDRKISTEQLEQFAKEKGFNSWHETTAKEAEPLTKIMKEYLQAIVVSRQEKTKMMAKNKEQSFSRKQIGQQLDINVLKEQDERSSVLSSNYLREAAFMLITHGILWAI